MKNKFIYWCAFITLVFLCLPVTALAADNPVGVAYRGHIQDLGDYPTDGSWVDSPDIIGTEGQSKRIEGFEIKLTGEIPAGMEMRYNVHVQNKGWLYDENDVTNWPKDGDYAGTRGESLRIEAVKIVLTDSDGKPVSGYSVQYRGHVQNVGDLPVDKSQWIKDGDQLGTVGSSLRLEALLVKVVKTVVEPVVYDKAGTYGPATGTEVINGDVIVKADGITLRNLHINGDLYIGTEQVVQKADKSAAATINEDQITTETTADSMAIQLQHLYIEYFTRPSAGTSLTITGSPSQAYGFSLPGGTQFTVTTPGGGFGTGAPMQITVGTSGGSSGGVSVGGAIGSLSLLTPGTQLSLSPGCQMRLLSVLMGAPNCGVITSPTALIQNALVQGTGAIFAGPGMIEHADIQADGASFATRPGAFTVAPGVATPPSMPDKPVPPNPGGGGGYTPTQSQPVISPSGAVAFPTTVIISSQGADAIYYTTDGSDPTTAGAQNTTKVVGGSAEISVASNITLKAIATRSGYYNSAIASATYTQAASADLTGIALSTTTDNFTFVPATYNYSSVAVPYYIQSITVTPTGSGVITVNGETVANGTPSVPITVSFQVEKTITIVNQETGKTPKTYTIKVTPGAGSFAPSQNPVTFSPAGGAMTFPATVTLSSTGADAIYYTTDGSDPTTVAGATNTTKNTGATAMITIGQAMTVKAIATRAGYLNSGVTSAAYTQAASADLTGIGLNVPAENFVFSATTYNYPNVTVANDVEQIFITLSGNSSSVITVNGMPVASNTQLATPIEVSYKIETTITIVNQEPSKAPKTYTIKVTPSSGDVIPKTAKLKSDVIATTTLDVNTSGIFGIKPGTTGVLSNVVFSSSNQTIIASGTSPDGMMPFIKDGIVDLTFEKASVTLDGITYPDVSLNNVVIVITSTAYLAKVNSGNGTVVDYAAAGITDVVAGNLSGINQAVAAARTQAGTELNQDAIQTVVAGYLAGANNFILALENSNSKMQNDAFNLKITNAKDSYGNLLNGNQTITLTSNPADLSYSPNVTFANGTVMVPINLSQIGDHGLTVAINGVTPIQNQAVTVYSKLNFSPDNTVSGYAAANDPVVVIPPDNNGTPVTAIGDNAFKENQTLTGVAIPASVISIGTSAFYNCPSFKNVTLTAPSTLQTIGNRAFDSCVKLTPFEIPASVITIGDGAFNSCNAFNTVTFAADSNLDTIGEGAFQACSMTTITIPANVTTIAKLAFQMCPELTTVNFAPGSQLTTIGEGAFYCCSLTTIQIPAKVTTIGKMAFQSNSLTELLIQGEGDLVIMESAFYPSSEEKNNPISKITIPAGVTINTTAGTMGSNDAGFIDIYNKIGGTYNYTLGANPTWTRQ